MIGKLTKNEIEKIAGIMVKADKSMGLDKCFRKVDKELKRMDTNSKEYLHAYLDMYAYGSGFLQMALFNGEPIYKRLDPLKVRVERKKESK